MQSKKNIKVRLSNNEIVPVEVIDTDAINSVLDFLPNGNRVKYRILHNSVVLAPAFSFAYHGIDDGDVLDVVKIPDIDRRWKPYCRRRSYCPTIRQVHDHSMELLRLYGHQPDLEMMQRAVEELSDPELTTLAAKFRDNYFNKIESNTSSYRKLLLRFEAIDRIQNERKISVPAFNIIRSAPSPSNSALPLCFEKSRKCDE